MNMQPVKSDKIDAIGYDEQMLKMRVCFYTEPPRDFLHVPKEIFMLFLNARSKNRFYKRHIADNFPC